MNTYDLMKSGALYSCVDEELSKLQAECLELQYDFNMTRPTELDKREEMLKDMFGDIGENFIWSVTQTRSPGTISRSSL